LSETVPEFATSEQYFVHHSTVRLVSISLPTGLSYVYRGCMTMLSFRTEEADALEAQRWSELLGVDRSELLREALRRHLLRLASENDATTWAEQPLEGGDRALETIAEWGPAEDWSDWVDATR
jgi:hypothetical protein